MRDHSLRRSARGNAVHRHVMPLARSLQGQPFLGLSETERQVVEKIMGKLLEHADRLAAHTAPVQASGRVAMPTRTLVG